MRHATLLWEALALPPLLDAALRRVRPEHPRHGESNRKAVISTSVGRLLATVKAQPHVSFDETARFKACLLVSALKTESFGRALGSDPVGSSIIMVDHNEFSQAVEGIEHHRLGTFTTKHPVTFINRVVGSTWRRKQPMPAIFELVEKATER